MQVNTDKSLSGTQSKVVYHRSDASSRERFYDTGIPASDLAGQQIKLEEKFENLVRPVLWNDTEGLKQYLLSIESADTILSM